MPNKNKAQEWLQTTMLAMGSVALATTSVAMIYLTSLASQGREAVTQSRETLSRANAVLDQLMGNAPHTEGSAVAELAPTLRALAVVLRDAHDSDLANRASVLVEQVNGSYTKVSDSDVHHLVEDMREISQYYLDEEHPLNSNAKSILEAPNGTSSAEYTEKVMQDLGKYATLLETSLTHGRGIYAIPAMTASLIQVLDAQIAAQNADSQDINTYKTEVRNVLRSVDAWLEMMLITSDGNFPRLHNLANTVPETIRNVQTGLLGGFLRRLGILPR